MWYEKRDIVHPHTAALFSLFLKNFLNCKAQ